MTLMLVLVLLLMQIKMTQVLKTPSEMLRDGKDDDIERDNRLDER